MKARVLAKARTLAQAGAHIDSHVRKVIPLLNQQVLILCEATPRVVAASSCVCCVPAVDSNEKPISPLRVERLYDAQDKDEG